MEIQKLKSEIIAKIRSTSTLNNVSQCVMELVLNSLDAKSTAIAVRVNLITFRIQIVDNGEGITRENFEAVGLRYMTNKCSSLEELEKQVKHYGFRGETLANVINMSKTVEITSKHMDSSETYSKTFGVHTGNVIKLIKTRPSCGTTITVEDFLYNVPVRRNRIVPELELEDIKKNVEYLVIIHPKVSFSVRNNVTGDLILTSKKNNDIITSFKYLHPQVSSKFSLMKVSKFKITVEALLFKEPSENKSLQYIYVNKRPVFSSKIQKFVANLFYKMQNRDKKSAKLIISKNRHPVYVINIKCPYSSVDILLNPSKTMVEFKNWNTVLRCLEKLVYSFFGSKEKVTTDRYLTEGKKVKSDCGISQMCGAFKAYGYKRRNLEENDLIPEKIQRVNEENIGDIIEETQFSRKIDTDKKIDEFMNLEVDRSKLFVDESEDFAENVCKKSGNSLKGCLKSANNKTSVDMFPSGDVYSISDFTPPSKKKINNFKRPLPIKMSCRNKVSKNPKPEIKKSQQYSDMKISPQNVNEAIDIAKDNVCDIKYQTDDEKSLYSKFTDDENKGKNLIMDMFLKSTQIYNSEEDIQSNPKSEETLFEVESNIFMENNFQTKVDGFSKTMSVSVNIKSTKKFRNKVKKKSSKCLQTSLGCAKMVSKCVQTSIDKDNAKSYDKIRLKRSDVDQKFADNYTVVFSDTAHSKNVPRFKFVIKREPPIFSLVTNTESFTQDCNCGCHGNKNIFNFHKLKIANENFGRNSVLNKIVDLSDSDSDPTDKEYDKQNYYGVNRDLIYPVINHRKCLDQFKKFHDEVPSHLKTFTDFFPRRKTMLKEGGDRSPYFLPKVLGNKTLKAVPKGQFFPNEVNQYSFYKFFDPQHKSTQLDTGYKEPIQKKCNNLDLETVNDFTIDNFGMFQPVYKSTQYTPLNWAKNFNSRSYQHKNYRNNVEGNNGFPRDYKNTKCDVNIPMRDLNICDENHSFNRFRSQTDLMNVSECFPMNDYNDPFINGVENCVPCGFLTPPKENIVNEVIKPSNELSKLVITLSNKEKQAMLEKELSLDKGLNIKKFQDWDSGGVERKCLENEWEKRLNTVGSRFYINKKTGYTTFFTPKPNCNQFKFDRRLEFMPKGLSPIMRKFGEVDKSLSQNKKDLLQDYILESHQDELLIVKWQNYINNKNPKEFFEEVYREKVEQFCQSIPCISTVGNKKLIEPNGIISFDKNLFRNITVIGQVDKKFIAVLEETKNLLIFFDQHAVHERIRLEELLKAYEGAKVECEEKFILFISKNDLSLLKKHAQYLNSLGLTLEFFENGVAVSGIPLCLYRKFKDNNSECTLNKAVQVFINEVIELLKATRGVSFKNLPPILQNIINLEACRGAIKFGDSLTTKVCRELLEKLSFCKLPFQCAHGRPTLTPLLTLNLAKKINFQKPNLRKIGLAL